MSLAASPTVQRARKTRRSGNLSRGYTCTWELLDESTQAVLVTTDLLGAAALTTVTFTDPARETWQMAPNRKIMPSSWSVTDPQGRFVIRFNQQILGS